MVAYRVGIVGAGVVGLNTAIALQNEFGDAIKITIIGEYFNEETTGDGAAGLFLPATYFDGPNEEVSFRWIKDSYEFYDAILHSEEGKDSGVEPTSGYLFSNVNAQRVENPFMKTVSETYRSATEEELSQVPGTAKYGSYMTTLTIACRYFLPWAQKRVCEKGAAIEKGKVTKWSELAERFDVIFNCTGLGAKELCNDRKLVAIRGQLFKVGPTGSNWDGRLVSLCAQVEAPWQKHFVFGDGSTYIIPNKEAVSLGGTREYDNYSLEINKHVSADIWERCCALVPSLSKAKVLREWVGLRPHRDPVRVETEFLNVPSHGTLKVIHNYGHGGYGVTSAPGTAKHASQLLTELHRASLSNPKN